jgi:hypothetical protein
LGRRDLFNGIPEDAPNPWIRQGMRSIIEIFSYAPNAQANITSIVSLLPVDLLKFAAKVFRYYDKPI